MKVKRLTGHGSMNCYIEEGEITLRLISYTTTVVEAVKEDEHWLIAPTGKYYDGDRVYTPTTARHISYFLREYFKDVTYQDFKKAALNKEDVVIAAYRR